ncbi:hypothetical protein EZS27_014191 [termite gut metagenome]|uniref:Uncharacterized protein n=1 Tax=termite gut metagenome TaxID=433724 RepID=A0A5J4RWE5_9ZZZZ
MIAKWEDFVETLSVFGNDVTEVLNLLKPSPQTEKIKKQINNKWEIIRKKANYISEIISPIDPEKIEYPYSGEVFITYWKRYKDYLKEEHHVFIRTRRENELLKTLKIFAGTSEKSEKKAISILSFLIRSGYRSFFRPTDKQLSGEEPATATEQQFEKNITKKSQV